MGSGEALAQPNFFFPVHFSHFLPGRGRGPAGDGGGEGGDSGENSLTRAGPLPAAHSRRPWEGLAGAISRLGGFGLQFPLPHSLGRRGLAPALQLPFTERFSSGWLCPGSCFPPF